MLRNFENGQSKIGSLNMTLIIRIQPSTYDLIDKWAIEQGASRSLVARQLLELGKRYYKGGFIVR